MNYRELSPDQLLKLTTLGELKAAGYQSRTVKDELRENLIEKLRKKEPTFEGIWGYEDTVIPDVERALLSKHNMNLLGLRGQAKTRIARQMVNLLDEYIPFITGSELNANGEVDHFPNVVLDDDDMDADEEDDMVDTSVSEEEEEEEEEAMTGLWEG